MIVNTLKNKTQQSQTHVILQEKYFCCFKDSSLGRDFPWFLEPPSFSVPAQYILRGPGHGIPFWVCGHGWTPRNQWAVSAHSGLLSILSFEQGVWAQLAKGALLVVLAPKSEPCQTESFHLCSQSSSLSCGLLCLLSALQGESPSHWLVGNIFLACCTPSQNSFSFLRFFFWSPGIFHPFPGRGSSTFKTLWVTMELCHLETDIQLLRREPACKSTSPSLTSPLLGGHTSLH